MINKQEIESKAQEFGIHPANVERDYVFGWLLSGIFAKSALRHTLVLKGGNAFRKAYFPRTRFSNDLDFSTTEPINVEIMREELNEICAFVQEKTGVAFDHARSRIDEPSQSDADTKVYKARLYFADFYGEQHTLTISVRLDFAEFDRIYLPVQERTLIHPYSDAADCSVLVRCQKLEELLASKLKCLLQRQHLVDLYDYIYSIFINREVEIDRATVVSTFLKKTIFEPSPGVVKRLLLDLPLELFRNIWSRYIVCPKESVIDFTAATRYFAENIELLFGRFPLDRYGQFAFFPSNFRNTIMAAASNLTLLELVYEGRKRLVEGYSLVFKRRKDGVGQEYFYAYDTTGGRTSGPGIKTFLHSRIGLINNTDIKFVPRFPVELSRSGELFGKSYFSSSFGGRRLRGGSGFGGHVYLVECAYCGKQFPRKKYSTRLRPHKDSDGYACFGRSGYIAY